MATPQIGELQDPCRALSMVNDSTDIAFRRMQGRERSTAEVADSHRLLKDILHVF